jgi:hypothetical protein
MLMARKREVTRRTLLQASGAIAAAANPLAGEWRHRGRRASRRQGGGRAGSRPVVLADGAEHVRAVRGTADNPMPRAEVVGKCRDLIAPVLGAATCQKLIDRVLSLESAANIRELRPLLQKVG